VHTISAVQIEYSAFSLDIEDPQINLLNTCRELGVTIVAYSPVGRGLLTGRYKSPQDFASDLFLSQMPRFSEANFPLILKLTNTLKSVAARKGYTAAQLAMAWLMTRGDDIIPIPGTRSTKYLEENVASLDVKLSAEEASEISDVAEKTKLQGAKYPALYVKISLFD
jgi:hypothetical protein